MLEIFCSVGFVLSISSILFSQRKGCLDLKHFEVISNRTKS